MSEASKSQRGAPAGQKVHMIITIVLTTGSLLLLVSIATDAYRFASRYWNMSQARKQLRMYAPPGSISLDELPIDMSLVVDPEGQSQMLTQLSDASVASQTVHNNAIWDSVQRSREAIEILRTSFVPVARRRQILQYFAATDHDPALDAEMTRALMQIVQDEAFDAELLRRVSTRWGGSQFRIAVNRRLGKTRSGQSKTIPLLSGTTVERESPETNSNTNESRIPPRDLTQVLTVAFAEDFPSKASGGPISVTTTAPAPAEPGVDSLPLDNAESMQDRLNDLIPLKPDAPLRQQIVALPAATVFADGIARWYEGLSIAWRDNSMLEKMLTELLSRPVAAWSDEDWDRGIRWAVATGDPRWGRELWQHLPNATLASRPPGHWSERLAPALNLLLADETDWFLESVDERTTRGLIARDAVATRTNWPDEVVERIVSVAENSQPPNHIRWLEHSELDAASMQRCTQRVARIIDPAKKLNAWKALRHLLHWQRLDVVATAHIQQLYQDGTLWTQIDAFLTPRSSEALALVAGAISSGRLQYPSAAPNRPDMLQRIDAGLATYLLAGETGKGEEFLIVAEDYGGPMTLALLEKDNTSDRWRPERVDDAIERIKTRMLLEGR